MTPSAIRVSRKRSHAVRKEEQKAAGASDRRDRIPQPRRLYGPAGIIVLPDGSRLFAGSDRGDFEEGLPQGSPESSLAFYVLIQEAVQELGSETSRSCSSA